MTLSDIRPLEWRKSTRSGSQGGNCVEVAVTADATLVRDSKNPSGGLLGVRSAGWVAFLDAVRSDKLR